ncbi:MAG: D-alanine--poly(phosphoribitol) ligase [Desulfuromonas sp.]|nr:MAG: D-alanine--poly(phosphoribitol) ligase [Desulfuromonas sp.]
MNLLHPFYEHALQHPDDLALWIDEEEISYGELCTQICAVARWIVQSRQGETVPKVGILAGRSLTAYVGILAATYAGATYVPLNFKAPPHYLSDLLKKAQIDILIVDNTGLDLIASADMSHLPERILSPYDQPKGESLPEIATGAAFKASSEWVPPHTVAPEDYAYLLFTSGSTGTPKGINVSVANASHLLTTLQQRYQFDVNDRLSQAFELTFDLSVFDIFMALRCGASLHVVPDALMPMPARFIQKQELTSWFSVPSMIGMLKQMKLLRPHAFPSLRLSLFCGEALPEESVTAWKVAAPNSRIENLYGPTEATVACLLQECTTPDCVTPDRGIIAIGQPFPGLKAGIVDRELNFLPQGERGELAIHGPQVAPGYLNNPQLSAQRFPILNHPEIGKSRWYLTGDLAYKDHHERYHFLGRVDNQVQLRGYRVELDEIEAHLRSVSGCDNAVVVFIHNADVWAQEIIGVLPDNTIDKGEVRRRLSNRLPPYMIPKKIVICEELPRNASGKIDRKALAGRLSPPNVRTSQ